jgi:DNA replication protein DnaC
MTLRQPCQDAVLPAADVAMIRQVLGACADLIAWAERHCGPQFAAAAADAAPGRRLAPRPRHPGRPGQPGHRLPRLRRCGRGHPVTGPAAPPLPAELDALIRRMRLPYLRKAAPDVIAAARAQRWEPAEVLRVLLAEEVTGRDAATRRMRRKSAGFPSGKTFSSWRPEESSVSAATQDALATLEWISRAENLVIAGPSGTGKSHLVEALAHAAIEKDLRVAWFTLETLTAAIGRASADGSIARTVTRICRSDLIVVDDIGMLPAGQDAGEAFYRITDAAYERRSMAVTSNIHPSGFDSIMPKTLATATVDRLLHHAHLVLTKGDSHRLAEALTGKGVIPLAT